VILGFVLLAAALTVAGVALIVVPLVRQTPAGPLPAPWTALAAAGVLVVGSAALYVTWSNWAWHAQPSASADSPQSMVARLARRLESEPGNLEDWLMLGRSYVVLQEYALAARAYERADKVSDGKSAEALTGEAEALAMGDQSELDGRAGQLIERALLLQPDSGKALFYGAVAAARRGDLPVARRRFVKLLAMNPPDQVRTFLEQQITAIDQRLDGQTGPGAAAAGAAGASPAQAAASTPGAGAAASAGDAGGSVRVKITVSPGLTQPAGSFPLFVFVRDPAHPGPPLAARRLMSEFPQTIELTAKDSMIAGRTFRPGDSVAVVARIARSGTAVGASGDPYGEVTYRVGKDGLASLVIDHLTP
jgi:cytochrome c-type biogenesis protein CcmH